MKNALFVYIYLCRVHALYYSLDEDDSTKPTPNSKGGGFCLFVFNFGPLYKIFQDTYSTTTSLRDLHRPRVNSLEMQGPEHTCRDLRALSVHRSMNTFHMALVNLILFSFIIFNLATDKGVEVGD